MMTLLTPSKTMDFTTPTPDFVVSTVPSFVDEAQVLRAMLRKYGVTDIMKLMRISRPLAERVVCMYQNMTNQKPALWAYAGDVFKGFQVATLDEDGVTFAQQHLLISSGLYGLLRPYDAITPYRLEMKAQLPVNQTTDMYGFWGEKLTRYMMARPNLDGELCVLSSEEYAKAVTWHMPPAIRVATPAFIDRKPGGLDAQIPIYNKMMRGVMARWIVDQRINSLDELWKFAAHGYQFDHQRSITDRPVFYRFAMKPLKLNGS